MTKLLETFNELNELLQLCEVMKQDMLAQNNRMIAYGNDNYEIYKEKILKFVNRNNIKEKYPYYYKLFGKYYYQNTKTWFFDLNELSIVEEALLGLKQILCKDMKNKIFISHSELDREAVNLFVELLYAIGVPHPTQDTKSNFIFCSSHPSHYINNGDPNKLKVKEELQKSDTFYVLWYSDNYFSSQCCLNEAGAIWVNNRLYQEILEPDFDSLKIKGLLDSQPVWLRADDKYRLNDFKNQIIEMFGLEMPGENHWENSRDKFIERLHALRRN